MEYHASGCLLCGADLRYFSPAQPLSCALCGGVFEADAACESHHYVCNACHTKEGWEFITRHALQASRLDPVKLSNEMMGHPCIHMHGPEHHYLIVAALLAAYKNAGGNIDLQASLQTAAQRAKNIPGGICGMWGSCGAGIGAGMFISIIEKATPLSGEEWAHANHMTSLSLQAIAANGGPRCCKRNVWLSVLQAIAYAEDIKGIRMERPTDWTCGFSSCNTSCKKEACLFHALQN